MTFSCEKVSYEVFPFDPGFARPLCHQSLSASAAHTSHNMGGRLAVTLTILHPLGARRGFKRQKIPQRWKVVFLKGIDEYSHPPKWPSYKSMAMFFVRSQICPITSETLLWILCSLRSNDIQANLDQGHSDPKC